MKVWCVLGKEQLCVVVWVVCRGVEASAEKGERERVEDRARGPETSGVAIQANSRAKILQ
jgi:hypothetical protein